LNLINKNFLIDLKKFIRDKEIIIVAVSGGPDSVSLLYNLLEVKKIFDIKIIVAHLNHKLRGDESFRDEIFVKQMCDKKKIIFVCERINVKENALKNKFSIEEAARIVRYDFLERVRKNNNASKIFVAHNKNDCVETIFLKLIRGSGIKSLAGINMINKNIIRPFINITHDEIINYCINNKIDYIIDSSNMDLKYDRNKIRRAMSIFKNINNNFLDNITRSCKIIDREDIFLNNISNDFIKKNIIKKNIIEIQSFNKLDIAIKRRVVKIILEKNIGIDSKKNSFDKIEKIINLIDKKNNKYICLDRELKVYKTKEKIIFTRDKIKIKEKIFYKLILDRFFFIKEIDKTLFITQNENIILDSNLYFKKEFYCINIKNLVVRNFESSDVIFFNQIGHKKVKKIISEKKVSILDKNKIAILCCENKNIICILNFFIFSNSMNGERFYIYISKNKI
jgi:tRNA(Ile)-lysidine synthase